MLNDANFLFEIGTEEIPAGYIPPAIEAVRSLFIESLKENRIDCANCEVYATPRRIAIMATGLAQAQREEEVELKGPAVKAAYDAEGRPTKALEGFLKGNGLSLDDLMQRDTGKGVYIYGRKKLAARATEEIVPEIITKIVTSISFPKRMRWSDKTVSFPRPIRYFLVLFNGRLIPFEMAGIAASDMTRGHYIQHNRMLKVEAIATYHELLKKNGVILDQNERREAIRAELQKAAQAAGGRLLEDEELLETVTFLVENPYVCTCRFDKEFLSLPDIILIAEMREHQKYFSVVDEAGRLTDYFLVVSNNPPTKYIIAGNERVIAARFNDARFFYVEDRKVRLFDRVESLKTVVFHKDLGTIYDKVERMRMAASEIAGRCHLDSSVKGRIERAVLLCKTDLMTAVVYEFPSLQGRIGRIYALEDGEDAAVADAIDDHYKPRFSGDPLPTSMVSIVVSLAEKIDNIFGSFSVGNIPKGSADPYALRRQAGAIVEILVDNNLNLELRDLLRSLAANYRSGADLIETILEFISVRARTLFSERGMAHDEIEACLAAGSSDYCEIFKRAKSIHEFRKNENFSRMLLGFKRMNNIVAAFRKEEPGYALSFDPSLFRCEEEKALHDFFASREKDIARFIAASDYVRLFELLIAGKPVIDQFFDKVLVMDRDVKLRDNRLHLLETILGNFTALMDFSRIEDRRE